MTSVLDVEFGQMVGKVSVSPPGPRSRELAADMARFEMPTSNNIKRGIVIVVLKRGICTRIQEQFHRFDISLANSPVERTPPIPALGIHVCSMIQQQANHFNFVSTHESQRLLII